MVEDIEGILELLKETYAGRLIKLLERIRAELESFSWHCSKISRLGDGVFSIAVSRDSAHLSLEGEPDDLDLEVMAYVQTQQLEGFGPINDVSFRIQAVSFLGENIGSLDPNDIFGSTVLTVSKEDIENRMQALEKIEPYEMVKLLQKWIKGKAAR